MGRYLSRAIALVLLLGSTQLVNAQTPPKDLIKLPGMRVGGTVTRDANNIASVWAANTWDLFYLQGYTVAGDRLFQMDSFRRQASGTLAERLGSAALSSDVQLRTFGLRRAAGLSLAAGSTAGREALDAYAAGQDGQVQLTLISTYLGHVDPAGTYWYLSASPELLGLAAQRLERHAAGQS